jgi:hypothetical protein
MTQTVPMTLATRLHSLRADEAREACEADVAGSNGLVETVDQSDAAEGLEHRVSFMVSLSLLVWYCGGWVRRARETITPSIAIRKGVRSKWQRRRRPAKASRLVISRLRGRRRPPPVVVRRHGD